MDSSLNEKYNSSKLTDELTNMFYEIIRHDEVLNHVFLFIAKTLITKEKTGDVSTGVIINDITENVVLTRQVRVKKGRTHAYEKAQANIHRKTAEKYVDILLAMSLIYYKDLKPYKFLHLTVRGKQVFKNFILENQSEKENN
ncbi:hypothetical protein ACFQZ1_08810 [Bacillus sp. CGMCC 1.60114]|uniref:hypothetical protein n=1 Tax=unclassified Bacillus (in: firmicutes) TaxID=185979 RepID=UPI003636CF8C